MVSLQPFQHLEKVSFFFFSDLIFVNIFFVLILAIQEVRNTTKTLGKQRLWDSTRRFLEQGPLKYEMDLYNFIKSLFHRKLLAFGINPDDPFGAPVAVESKDPEGMSDFEKAFGDQPAGVAPIGAGGQQALAALPAGGANSLVGMNPMDLQQMQMAQQMQMQMQQMQGMAQQMPMQQMPMQQMPMGAMPQGMPMGMPQGMPVMQPGMMAPVQ